MRILLLIESAEDRRILLDELGTQHEVTAATEDAALDELFDLCILDSQALQRLNTRIDMRRALETPCFLPFLLLTTEQEIAQASEELWLRIDDALPRLFQIRELRTRVNMLLRARLSSVLLDRERQALEDSEALFRSLAENANALIGIIQGT